jgi:hypothetical protein
MKRVLKAEFDSWIAAYPHPLKKVPVPAGGSYGKWLYYDGAARVAYMVDRTSGRAPAEAIVVNDYYISQG